MTINLSNINDINGNNLIDIGDLSTSYHQLLDKPGYGFFWNGEYRLGPGNIKIDFYFPDS